MDERELFLWRIRKAIRIEVFNFINIFLENCYLDSEMDIQIQNKKLINISKALIAPLKKGREKIKMIQGVEHLNEVDQTKKKLEDLILQLNSNLKINTKIKEVSKRNIYHSILNGGLFIGELYIYSCISELSDDEIVDLFGLNSPNSLGKEIKKAVKYKGDLFKLYKEAGFFKKSHEKIKEIEKYLKFRELPDDSFRSNLKAQISRGLVGTGNSYFRFRDKNVLEKLSNCRIFENFSKVLDILTYFRYEYFLVKDNFKAVINFNNNLSSFSLEVIDEKCNKSEFFELGRIASSKFILSIDTLNFIESNRHPLHEDKTTVGLKLNGEEKDNEPIDESSMEYLVYKGKI